MSVAGFKEYVYKFPGACAAFYSDLFHGSGEAEMRTVKIGFFVALSEKPSPLRFFHVAASAMGGTTTTEGKPAAAPAVPPPAAVPPPPEVSKEQEQEQEQEQDPEQEQEQEREQERERGEDEEDAESTTALQPVGDLLSGPMAEAAGEEESDPSEMDVSADEEIATAPGESFQAANGDGDDKQPAVSGKDSTPAADGQPRMQKADKHLDADDPERATVPAAPAVATTGGTIAGKRASIDSKQADGGSKPKRTPPAENTRDAQGN
jgi:hypothetical protein